MRVVVEIIDDIFKRSLGNNNLSILLYFLIIQALLKCVELNNYSANINVRLLEETIGYFSFLILLSYVNKYQIIK